ncbi:hypothetical protein LP7551_03529 [Roseibium album]|nr:hypothetical protein LP7551_03529 [Roseibium album]
MLSQAFATLSALRPLVLAYVAVNCAISFFETWVVDSPVTVALYAPFGAVFCYCFYRKLVDVDIDQNRYKIFGKFAFWYIVLMGAVNFVVLYLLNFFLDAAPSGTQEFWLWWLALVPSSALVYFVSDYFFESVLPAQIFGKKTQFLAAPRRAVRQGSYLLPKFLGLYSPISALAAILFAAALFVGPTGVPVTASGDFGPVSLILLVSSELAYVLAQAVLMVMMARAYMRDLREIGEIPAVEAEVFA